MQASSGRRRRAWGRGERLSYHLERKFGHAKFPRTRELDPILIELTIFPVSRGNGYAQPERLATRQASWLDTAMRVWLEVATPWPRGGEGLLRVLQWVAMGLEAWIRRASGGPLRAITLAARHTGIPAVVAAIALVLAYRIARRALHLLVEVALAIALVLAAVRAGWLRF